MINNNSCKLSSNKNTSNTTDNQTPSSNLKIGSFKQSININITGANTPSPQIFVTNSNNIILNTTSINNDNNQHKLNNQTNPPPVLSQQHHHYHHHVHHIRKNQIKRKRQRTNNDSNNIDCIAKSKVNKLFIGDDERNLKSEIETKSNSQIRRFNTAYSSF